MAAPEVRNLIIGYRNQRFLPSRNVPDINRSIIFSRELAIEEAKQIALRAVKAAITRNIGTGDGINIAIMDKDGFRLLTDEQKKAVIEL
jgi:20S proteasome alpha/beta subunit